MRFVSALLLSLVLSTVSYAVDIVAPTTAYSCSLIRARSATEAKSYLWFISTSNNDIVDFQQYDSDKAVVFTGPPGKYLVRCVILTEDGKLEQAHHIITVSDYSPPTPVPPGPVPPGPVPPTPQPVGDCAQAGSPVAIEVCKVAHSLPPAAQRNIAAVAAAYDQTIAKAQAAEQGYISINEISAKLKAARTEAMGDPASWSAWADKVSPMWDKLWADNGGKPSRTQVLEFHSQVGRGLKHSIGK